nr:MAG TPA: hypothetical protein [Caudoviricetes sp.]
MLHFCPNALNYTTLAQKRKHPVKTALLSELFIGNISLTGCFLPF